MPIKHAALKQIRKDRKRHDRNQADRMSLRTLTKRFTTLLSAKKVDEAKILLPAVVKAHDRAASKRIIHRNTASRLKSRLTRRLNQLTSTAA